MFITNRTFEKFAYIHTKKQAKGERIHYGEISEDAFLARTKPMSFQEEKC